MEFENVPGCPWCPQLDDAAAAVQRQASLHVSVPSMSGVACFRCGGIIAGKTLRPLADPYRAARQLERQIPRAFSTLPECLQDNQL